MTSLLHLITWRDSTELQATLMLLDSIVDKKDIIVLAGEIEHDDRITHLRELSHKLTCHRRYYVEIGGQKSASSGGRQSQDDSVNNADLHEMGFELINVATLTKLIIDNEHLVSWP